MAPFLTPIYARKTQRPSKIISVTKVLLVLFLKPIVAYASLKAPAYVTIPPLDELHYPSRLLILTTDLNPSNNTTKRVSATSTLIKRLSTTFKSLFVALFSPKLQSYKNPLSDRCWSLQHPKPTSFTPTGANPPTTCLPTNDENQTAAQAYKLQEFLRFRIVKEEPSAIRQVRARARVSLSV